MTTHNFDPDALLADLRRAEQLAAHIALYGDEDAPAHLARLLYWAAAADHVGRDMLLAEEMLTLEELAMLQAELDPDIEGLWDRYRWSVRRVATLQHVQQRNQEHHH